MADASSVIGTPAARALSSACNSAPAINICGVCANQRPVLSTEACTFGAFSCDTAVPWRFTVSATGKANKPPCWCCQQPSIKRAKAAAPSPGRAASCTNTQPSASIAPSANASASVFLTVSARDAPPQKRPTVLGKPRTIAVAAPSFGASPTRICPIRGSFRSAITVRRSMATPATAWYCLGVWPPARWPIPAAGTIAISFLFMDRHFIINLQMLIESPNSTTLPSLTQTLAGLKPGQRYRQPHPPGSGDAWLLAELAQEAGRTLVVFCAQPLTAQRLSDEISLLAPQLTVRRLPDWETLPYDNFSPHEDLISERLRTLHALTQDGVDILTVPVTTALYRLPPASFLAAYTFSFKQGEVLDEQALKDQLMLANYRHVTQVTAPGEFAIRGGLIDLFPMGSVLPYRLDLFDNEIESMRSFNEIGRA